MHFYRGSGQGAAIYFDEGHGRAEAYYTEGHQAVVQVDTWRGGERLTSAVLEDRGELEAWVEGRTCYRRSERGYPPRRPGAGAVALRRGGGQQPQEPVGGGHPGPGGGGRPGAGDGPPGRRSSAGTCPGWR